MMSLCRQQVDNHNFLLDNGFADDNRLDHQALVRPFDRKPSPEDGSHYEHNGQHQDEHQGQYGVTVQE